MEKIISEDKRLKRKILKGKLLFNQIATRNTNEKKAEQVELARKLDANVRVTNFRVLFALVCRGL